MRLIDLLSTGKQTRTIPKSEIPGLLGEVETLKAKLWLRLTEWEEVEPVLVFAKSAKERMQFVDKPNKPIQSDQIPGLESRILRTKEVIRKIGLSRPTIWRMERDGKFPKHRNIGPRSTGWLDTEINEWIGTRQCGRTR
jgi:prophage regulatory protein